MISALQPARLILFSASLTILVSCGAGVARRTPASTYSSNELMSTVGDLTPEERAIATRICYAYQSKNLNFRTTTYTEKIFGWAVINKDCSNQSRSYSIKSTLEASFNQLAFKSTSTTAPFETTIQTNAQGYLAQLCTKIQNNQAISNTADSGDQKVQVQFFKDSRDAYRIQYFKADTNGEMRVTKSETFKVRTQFNLSSGQILGMDESYTKYQNCQGIPDQYSEFYQDFSGLTSK